MSSTKPLPERACWAWAGWEPDRYYRRIGAKSTEYFGNGDWIADWRRNLESDETLRYLSQSGVNILVTRFYKGFSPEVERADWSGLIEFVEKAHDQGMEVWGYLQGQSIFGECVFNHLPEARNWIAKDFEGRDSRWAGAYNRFAPCLTNEGFQQMIASIAEEGLRTLNLDGIHMDNNYYKHCYCDQCKALFRDWLSLRGDLESITGLTCSRSIEPPNLVAGAAMIPDPLAILWIEFGVQQRAAFLKKIGDKIRSVRMDAHFTGNPGFLRNYAPRLSHALDPALEGQLVSSLCIENGNQPRFEGGHLYTQADKHLFAQATNLPTWVTSWRSGEFGNSPPATAKGIWGGLAEEFSFRHAFLGNNWMLRPAGDGAELLKDRLKELSAAFQEALAFFQRLESSLDASDREQFAEICLYVDTHSLSLCPASDAVAVESFLGQCLQRRISIRIVLQGQAIPAGCRLALVFGLRCMKDEELARLFAFAKEPGRQLFLIGDCGVYNEWFVARSLSVRRSFESRPGVTHVSVDPSLWIPHKEGRESYFRGHSFEVSGSGARQVHELYQRIGQFQSLRVEAPEGVLCNIEHEEGRRLIVHLRDLREALEPVGQSEIYLTHREGPIPGVMAYAPGWNCQKLECERVGHEYRIVLPCFSFYVAVVLQTEVCPGKGMA